MLTIRTTNIGEGICLNLDEVDACFKASCLFQVNPADLTPDELQKEKTKIIEYSKDCISKGANSILLS